MVELASSSDAGPRGLQALRQKMELYQRHGARLGWLIIPHFSQVEVWMGSGSTPELLSRPSRLDGSTLCPDLVVNLEPLWAL